MSISLKHTLLGLSATAVLCGLTTSAALATPRCTSSEQGGDYAVCSRTSPTGTQKEFESPNKLQGTGGESVALEAKIVGVTLKVVCKTDTFSDTPEDSGGSTGSVIFEECKVGEPKNCKLPKAQEERIVENVTTQLATPPASPRSITLSGSGPGEQFTSITIETRDAERCSFFTGTFSITGNTGTGCGFDTAIETFAFEHTLTCIAKGEKVKLGGNTVSFTLSATLKTSTTEQWAILES